jgi:transposase-like protein
MPVADVLQEPFRLLYHPTIMAERRIFKWRHFAPEISLCAVRWYLRCSLSYREVQELLEEREVRVDHTTVWRWVQCYTPELEQRTRPHLKPTNKSWRVDETYIRIRGHWFYLYPALDSSGASIDFILSAVRSAAAAKALLDKSLSDRCHQQPRVINTDKALCYPLAISEAKDQGILRRRCRHRPVPYLDNILEQDHRAIKADLRQATFLSLRLRAANNSRSRDDPQDSERARTMVEKGGCAGRESVHRPHPRPDGVNPDLTRRPD